MSKSAATLLALVLAAAGFGVGFGLGHRVASSPAPEEATIADRVESALPPGPTRALLRAAFDEPDPFERVGNLAKLLPTLGPEAVLPVRSLLTEAYYQLDAAETELLVRFWALHDAEAATDWALTNVPVDIRQPALSVALERWATVDPEAALARIQRAGSGNLSRQVLGAVILGWYASGLPGLDDYIRDLGVGFDRQRALSIYAAAMISREGSEAAMRWAESVPDEPWHFKIDVYRHLSSELARLDLDAAKAWCKAHCDEAKFPHGANLRSRIAAVWARIDGAATFEWLSHAPPGGETDEAVKSAYRSWSWDDPSGVVRWVDETMSPDDVQPWFEPAIEFYALAISWDRPEAALQWAAHIPNEEKRNNAMITIALRWREVDPAAAEAWVAQSPLDEAHRAKARTFPEGFRGHAYRKQMLEKQKATDTASSTDEGAKAAPGPEAGE